MKVLIQVLTWVLPWTLRRRLLNALFRFEIDPDARVGYSILCCDRVICRAGSSIGHLNVIRGLSELRLGEYAQLGSMNWICGEPRRTVYGRSPDRRSELSIEDHAAITHQHLFDCSDRIVIGRFSTVAGYRSQFLTHSINVKESCQETSPIVIGEYCFIGSAVTILKAVRLPNATVVGAASVVTRSPESEGSLVAGVPAKFVRSATGAYFSRVDGTVR